MLSFNSLSACLSPVQLFTRRREFKGNVPRPSDRIRDLNDMSVATCGRLSNLKQSAKAESVDLAVDLPEKPIETGKALFLRNLGP